MKATRDKHGYVPGGHPCPDCGKRCWETRADAKRIARRMGKQTRHLAAYRCSSGWWHLGHLPTIVARGRSTRDDIGATVPRPPSEERPSRRRAEASPDDPKELSA